MYFGIGHSLGMIKMQVSKTQKAASIRTTFMMAPNANDVNSISDIPTTRVDSKISSVPYTVDSNSLIIILYCVV